MNIKGVFDKASLNRLSLVSLVLISASLQMFYLSICSFDQYCYLIPATGNTKGGNITVPLTSCLTGLESTV